MIFAIIHRQKVVNQERLSYLEPKDPILLYVCKIPVFDGSSYVQKQQTISRLQCFYNMFNDENFDLKTKIFTDETNFVCLLKNVISNEEITLRKIIEEREKERSPDQDVCKTIVKKRIYIEMLHRTHGAEFQLETSHKKDNIDIKDKPTFCKDKCLDCKLPCNFTVNEITRVINIVQIQDEMKLHGHPSSRSIKGWTRSYSSDDKRKELIEHYKFVHKNFD